MGGHQSQTVKIYFRKNSNYVQFMDDKHNLFFVIQISDNLQNVRDQNYLVGYMPIFITVASNKP